MSFATRKTSTQDIVDQVIRDVTPPDGSPAIDLIVASHRHADHVSGFAQDVWDQVQVKEVWLPWTEDPEDKVATHIRTAQTGFAMALAGTLGIDAATDLQGVADDSDPAHGDAAPLAYLALNALSNDTAMARLHSGFAGNPRRRFLPEKVSIGERILTAALPGLTTHVLGPSRAEGDIRDVDPPVDQSYLALNGQGALSTKVQPFPKEWIADRLRVNLSDEDKQSIRTVNHEMLDVLAVALDKAINGTSLMLVFELFGKHLLFPGDAQWGTWRRALTDENAIRLLRKTVFYKVGHHGSHNATPVDFVEKVLDRRGRKARKAMISVRPRSNWKQIPRKPLIEALGGRIGGIARSDIEETQDGFARFGNLFVDAII